MNITDAQRSDQLRGDARNEQSEKSGGFSTSALAAAAVCAAVSGAGTGVQHLLHLKSKSKILRPIEIMGFFYEIFCQIQGNILL